jgi:hypothetical protein
MKRVLRFVLLLPISVGLVPTASASWGPFISTGTTTGVGNPSCAAVSTNHVVCAVLSGKSAVMVNEFNGTSWGKWTSLAGEVSSAPSCTSNGGGDVICAAVAAGSFEWELFNGTAWTKPAKVTAALYSAPSCAEYLTGQVLCVARNALGGLAYSVYNGTSWSAFANLSTVVTTSAPSCTTDNNNGVICAVYTAAYATLVNRYSAGAWASFLNLGGDTGGKPDCTSMNSGGEVACFAKAYSSGVFINLFDGGTWAVGSWSGYGGMGGAVNDNVGCTSQVAGGLVCGAISAINSMFYADVDAGSGFGGFAQIDSEVGVGSPSCAPLGTSQVVCVVMGTNNELSSVVGP